ncbi:MAG: hypothetical protein ACRD3Z_03700 [Nitrososphaerales archaeon]
MVDFKFLEEIAVRIKADRQQLLKVDDELSRVNAKLHELPLKSATESAFAKMIGMEYQDEIAELEKQRDRLAAEKNVLSDTIDSDMQIMINELTSPELIIPIEPTPKLSDGKMIYKYRNEAKFPNLFDILAELLGLSTPIVVKDVMLSSSEIVISEKNELDAKKKFISIMNEVQKTLSIKKRKTDSFL